MAGITRVSGAAGIASGGWALAGYYLEPGSMSTLIGLTEAVAAGTIALGLAAIWGIRRGFLGSAALGALLGAMLVVEPYGGSPSGLLANYIVLGNIATAGATVVLSLAAAREGTEVSEQSHPMNLPVFG